MIFLEIPFFRHYVFAVVQKSSSPTHPGGNPPSIKVRACARAKRKREDAQRIWWTGYRCPHRILNITTGTVALLLNHMPFNPSKQRPYKIFRVFRAFRGQKMGCGRWFAPSCFQFTAAFPLPVQQVSSTYPRQLLGSGCS
jgi:hypothetical protein